MKKDQTVTQDQRIRQAIMFLYLAIVGTISYTAFNSPFVAKNYWGYLIFTHIAVLLISIYLIDYKNIKAFIIKSWKDAETRGKLRKEIAEKLKKEYEG